MVGKNRLFDIYKATGLKNGNKNKQMIVSIL